MSTRIHNGVRRSLRALARDIETLNDCGDYAQARELERDFRDTQAALAGMCASGRARRTARGAA